MQSLALVIALVAFFCGAADATSNDKCLTQKMLISCVPGKSSGVIECGSAAGLTSAPSSELPMATEVLLDWNHRATSRRGARLSVELSKPSSALSLVLLDLSTTRLCTGDAANVQLKINYQSSPGLRLALSGLQLPAVSRLSLDGNIVINTDLLAGFSALERLAVVGNNVSVSGERRARYTVTGAPRLAALHIRDSIHSLAYDTPLLDSLAQLHSVHLNKGNMLLLRAGIFKRLPALRYLYLSHNNLQDMETGALAGLSKLEHLYLNANGLKRLANYAFGDLAALRRLSLANNRLSEIRANAFHGLTKLEHLDLSDNQLRQLPEVGFAQLHSLQTLDLRQNRDLRYLGNDTFCPLEALRTLWTDAPLDCQRFGSPRVVQFVRTPSVGPPKKYSCSSLAQLAPTQLRCHDWLDRLAQRLRRLQQQPSGAAKTEELPVVATSGGERPQQHRLSVILLAIFGVICLVHVLTTAVTIYVCRQMRRSRRTAGGVAAQRKSPSVSSPEEERSLDASPGVSKEPALLSFQPAGNGSKRPTGGTGDRDGARDKLNVRDKSYDFNEDETRS